MDDRTGETAADEMSAAGSDPPPSQPRSPCSTPAEPVPSPIRAIEDGTTEAVLPALPVAAAPSELS
eukprot:4774156-Alexandrium_andersonii.AAC.1